jgi:hypothetical protein
MDQSEFELNYLFSEHLKYKCAVRRNPLPELLSGQFKGKSHEDSREFRN